jgi:alpha-L-fucosidase
MSSRREFMAGLAAGLGSRLVWAPPGTRPHAPDDPLAIPSLAQLAWLDLEVGMFVHFAPNTWQDQEYDDRSIPADLLPFTADAEQWADTAVALGARYVVLVAKHVGGFCLWQTTTSEYSVRNTSWKGGRGDVMEDLAQACRTRGLGLGVYLSPRDDFYGAGLSGRCATPEKQDLYNRVARQQLTELLTRYGPQVEIWFDGGSVVPVGDLLAQHAKNAMVFQGPQATVRWVGNEDGFAPDPVWNGLAKADAATGIATALHGDPHGDAWMPLEVDVSIRRPNWFWSAANDANLLRLDQLVEIYYRSVGRGTQLLLNLPPDRSGRIPDADAARAKAFGDEIRRRFAQPVAQTDGAGGAIALALKDGPLVDHVVLEEDLRAGQRILSYRLDGLLAGGWHPLGAGTSIGHKRILPIAPGRYSELRVVFPNPLDRPVLRTFSAYQTGAEPPATWQQAAQVWADDDAGSWVGGMFDLDLTERIDRAAQYRVRFIARGSGVPRLRSAALLIDGVPHPELLRSDAGRGDILFLSIPSAGPKIQLSGEVSGAAAGVILLRRL